MPKTETKRSGRRALDKLADIWEMQIRGQSAPPMPAGQQIENLSIGLGRGITNNLDWLAGLATEPARQLEFVDALRTMAGNPRQAGSAMRDYYAQQVRSPLGQGEAIGEFIDPWMAMAPAFRGVRAADDLSRVDFPALEKPKTLTRASKSVKHRWNSTLRRSAVSWSRVVVCTDICILLLGRRWRSSTS